MVTGIESFKKQFEGMENQYTIIGGTACDLLMSEAGEDFRATKDIDIVLIISLHPYIKEIQIDESTEFYKELIQCIDTGLVIKGVSCRLTGEGIIIDKQIPIKYK